MTEKPMDLSSDYLNAHWHKSNAHIATAFKMKSDELIAAGADPRHPAVVHLMNRANEYWTGPENN